MRYVRHSEPPALKAAEPKARMKGPLNVVREVRVVADIGRGVAIGIDAGGTKTVAILVDDQGREVNRATSGGANPYDVGPEAARYALACAVEPLMVGGNVRSVCLGSAGIDREGDRRAAEAMMRAIVGPELTLDVRNDAAAALGLLGPKRPAMAVIAGTGSIAYGEHRDGSPVRAGGHGAVIGDAGSAAAFGLAAVRHTAGVLDGVERESAVSKAVVAELKLAGATDIVTKLMRPELDVVLIASLAPLVESAYKGGDAAAKRIVETETAALTTLAKHVARLVREQQSTLPVLLVGGVFSAVPYMRDEVKAGLKLTGPVLVSEFSECVMGAARIALESAAPKR
jgi:N-acetylglucosamine kinase-like BadF-type ATPase